MRVHANIGCTHFPLHDPWAWELTLRVLDSLKLSSVNLLGDIYDFEAVSGRPVRWTHYRDGGLQQDLDTGFGKLLELRSVVGDIPIHILPGNHDLWMLKYLDRHPGLASLRALTLPELWRLDELGFIYHEDEIEIIPGTLYGSHGQFARKDAGQSALAELERAKYQHSTVTAHTHRAAKVHVTYRDTTLIGVETGCLRTKDAGYVRDPNWQHAISLVVESRDNYDVDLVVYSGEGRDMSTILWGTEMHL